MRRPYMRAPGRAASHRGDRPVTVEDQRHRVSLELLPEPPPSTTLRPALLHHRHDYLLIEVSSQQGDPQLWVDGNYCAVSLVG